MNEPRVWPERSHSAYALVARFAEFYREVAAIKRAQVEGRLASYLAGDNAPAPSHAAEFAQRVSARLLILLKQQERNCSADAASEAGQLERKALYLMAALADEIFIFELDWPGCDAWLPVLLEHSMFGTSNAGSRFFSMANQLVRDNLRSPMQMDFAAIFLLAMELGFKGCFRARQAQAELVQVRNQLYRIVAISGENGGHEPKSAAFAQAYAYTLTGRADERLAPVSPWCNLGLYGLVGYLLLSTVIWMMLMYPFERYLSV